MRDLVYTLRVPATSSADLGQGPGLGTPQRCRDLRDKVVEVTGSFTGSITIEIKVAHAFIQFGAPITQAGLVPISVSAEWLRVNATSMSGGPPTCVLRGLDTRSEG